MFPLEITARITQNILQNGIDEYWMSSNKSKSKYKPFKSDIRDMSTHVTKQAQIKAYLKLLEDAKAKKDVNNGNNNSNDGR